MARSGGEGDDLVDTAVVGERRRRVRSEARAPRHRQPDPIENFTRSFTALGSLAYQGAQVSACVIDLDTERVLLGIDERIVLPVASIGKVLLLIEVAAQLDADEQLGLQLLEKSAGDRVAESGLWRHLHAPSLPIADLAALVGASSDNLATNVLLRRVGLPAIRERGESIGLARTALLDRVRDERGPDDAPQLSVGSTLELGRLFFALARGEVVSPAVSAQVLGWLSLGSDLSMVASAFGLDPFAHRESDHGLLLVNKTGSDEGVRAEAGVVRGPRAAVAYSVAVHFADESVAVRLRVLETMRTVGLDLLDYLH